MANENILDDNTVTLDRLVTREKHESTFVFKNKTEDELAESIQGLLIKKGYKLELGNQKLGTYGKGSKIARALLGAFIKRFAFKINISNDGEASTLHFSKDGKGYLGGAIGVAQVKKEYESIADTFEKYHAKTMKELLV